MHRCAYTTSVSYQWDANKAASNRKKHGVDFADAAGVLEDTMGLTVADDHGDEERWVTMGTDFLGRLLVVVWTSRGDDQRLISAREATKGEQRQYEEGS